ncbi:hypothetical protein ACQZV8_14210 [Magnetococcales bacterium HHB-1]
MKWPETCLTPLTNYNQEAEGNVEMDPFDIEQFDVNPFVGLLALTVAPAILMALAILAGKAI